GPPAEAAGGSARTPFRGEAGRPVDYGGHPRDRSRQRRDNREIRRLLETGTGPGRASATGRATPHSVRFSVRPRAWLVAGSRPASVAGTAGNTRSGIEDSWYDASRCCSARRVPGTDLRQFVPSREFQDRLGRRAKRAGVNVPPKLASRLETYFRLLESWNRKINLTGLNLAEATPETIDRLLIEPLVAARHLPTGFLRMLDVG